VQLYVVTGERRGFMKVETPNHWIRYERKHSLTAIHLDWYTGKIDKKELSKSG